MDTVSQELLPHWQKKMMLMCWIAYVCAYLVRTNLSVALPGMSADFRWSNAAAGLIGTAFFWCYAIGQLINGFVGDKFTSRGLVFLGLLASGIFNILVGLSNNYIAIIIFWAFNGFVLSMLWGPIVRTTAAWFPESRRTGVAVILSLSMIGGYIISWGGVAQLASVLGWRCDFLLPASVTLIFAFIWLWQARSDPHQLGLEVTDDVPQPAGQPPREPEKPEAVIKKSTLEIFIENRFWFLACACLSLGFVKEGILLWSPTFLIKAQRLSPSAASAFSLVIPVIGTAGILLSGWLHKLMHNQSKKAAAVLFTGAVLSSVLLVFLRHSSLPAVVVLLGLTVAFMYGANTILLTIVPYSFGRYGKISTVAGTLDFCSYIGAACTGIVTGAVIDTAGWDGAILLWAVLSVFGVTSIMLSYRADRSAARVKIDEQGEQS
jgi:sugar phosphate permease